jgi:hypothetical protein
MVLKETECVNVDWIRLAEDTDQLLATANNVMMLEVP